MAGICLGGAGQRWVNRPGDDPHDRAPHGARNREVAAQAVAVRHRMAGACIPDSGVMATGGRGGEFPVAQPAATGPAAADPRWDAPHRGRGSDTGKPGVGKIGPVRRAPFGVRRRDRIQVKTGAAVPEITTPGTEPVLRTHGCAHSCQEFGEQAGPPLQVTLERDIPGTPRRPGSQAESIIEG